MTDDDLRAPQPEQQHRPTVRDEFCWLVELFEGDGTGNSAGWYHTGFVDIGGHSRTTGDPFKARRYDTREQAEAVAAELGPTLMGTWRAVEHGLAPPPAAPEPSEAEVAAAMASLYRAMEPAAWPSEDEITDALRAAAAARTKC